MSKKPYGQNRGGCRGSGVLHLAHWKQGNNFGRPNVRWLKASRDKRGRGQKWQRDLSNGTKGREVEASRKRVDRVHTQRRCLWPIPAMPRRSWGSAGKATFGLQDTRQGGMGRRSFQQRSTRCTAVVLAEAVRRSRVNSE